jgi:hypothetical protein
MGCGARDALECSCGGQLPVFNRRRPPLRNTQSHSGTAFLREAIAGFRSLVR